MGLTSTHTFCKAKWHQHDIRRLHDTGKRVDVQVVLSIFHWLRIHAEKGDTVSMANNYLKQLFLSSSITFLELPKVGSKMMQKMKYWIGDRESVREIIGDAVSELQSEGWAA